MAQELAGRRIRDDGALVADDRLGPCQVAPHGLEHAPRDDDHPQPAFARRGERGAGARPQDVVRSDERPVEVARDRVDARGKVGGEPQDDFVRNATRSLTCASVSVPLNSGMTPFGKPETTYTFGSTIDSCV